MSEQLKPTLPDACRNLPFVCQEGVLKALGTVKDMGDKGLWFKSRTPEKLNLLLPKVNRITQKLIDSLRPYREKVPNFNRARDAAWYAARDAAWYAARDAAGYTGKNIAFNAATNVSWYITRDATWDAARDATGFAARDAAIDTVVDAARFVAWETIKDLPGFGNNPFLHYFRLYKLGAANINFRPVQQDKEKSQTIECLVVHLPLILPDEEIPYLGCLVFPTDSLKGDRRAEYMHEWREPCSKIRLVSPTRVTRIIK